MADMCGIDMQLMHGIHASLQPPDSCPACSTGIMAHHDSHRTAGIPIQLPSSSDAQPAQQADEANPEQGLSQAESVQPKDFLYEQSTNSNSTAISSRMLNGLIIDCQVCKPFATTVAISVAIVLSQRIA